MEDADLRRTPRHSINVRCAFFRLPGELRDKIYGYSLLQATQIVIKDHESLNYYRSYSHYWRPRPAGLPDTVPNYQPFRTPTLLHLCRLIREETLPMFFGNNTFYIAIDRTAYRCNLRWLQQMDPRAIAALRVLCIEGIITRRRGPCGRHGIPYIAATLNLCDTYSETAVDESKWRSSLREKAAQKAALRMREYVRRRSSGAMSEREQKQELIDVVKQIHRQVIAPSTPPLGEHVREWLLPVGIVLGYIVLGIPLLLYESVNDLRTKCIRRTKTSAGRQKSSI